MNIEKPEHCGPPAANAAGGPLGECSPPASTDADPTVPWTPEFFSLAHPITEPAKLAAQATARLEQETQRRHPQWSTDRVTHSVQQLFSNDVQRQYFVEREAYLREHAAQIPSEDEQHERRQRSDQLMEDVRSMLRRDSKKRGVTPSDE